MPVAVRIDRCGGPEVLHLVETQVGAPAPGELRLRQTAVGLNFIDSYHRSGLYPIALPSGLGSEAAGIVEAVGAGVSGFSAGDRVAYFGGPLGAYADVRLVPAAQVLKLPAGVTEDAAAALLLKGMTAYCLLHLTYPVTSGQTLLIHAAAGGVASALVPWARYLGATVIGSAGGPDKCRLALEYGCHHAIDYRSRDFVAEVKRLTEGRGVDVVYDSVGRDTFAGSLDCLRRRGMMVSFGNASGKPPAIEPATLGAKGSLYLTRPSLFHYTTTRAELEQCANALFGIMGKGVVKADIRQRYALRDAAKAHAALEARATTGASLLIP